MLFLLFKVRLLAFFVTSIDINSECGRKFDLMVNKQKKNAGISRNYCDLLQKATIFFRQLEFFSLQLMHEPIIFSAGGIFQLKYTLFRTVYQFSFAYFIPMKIKNSIWTRLIFQIIAGITTYVVIFIQFFDSQNPTTNKVPKKP